MEMKQEETQMRHVLSTVMGQDGQEMMDHRMVIMGMARVDRFERCSGDLEIK